MKRTCYKTLKPVAIAALLVISLPADAATALSGSYDTINTPNGFTMTTGDTVISRDGKFVTGGSMQDMNGATLILASENASIETGGRFTMGTGASIKQSEESNLTNLDFKGGQLVLEGGQLNVDGTLSYYSEGGVATGSYIEVINNGQLNVDRLVSTSYYTLNVSHNGGGGTATIRELVAPGLVSVEKNGVLNIGERATIGHFWNFGGTVNAENAVVEISPREDMMPQDYEGKTYVYEDGKTYVFGNGIDKSQGEGDKEAGTMNVGTLIVHGNALNADNSTLNATEIRVDEALKNETGANINVSNGSITAKVIDGAEGLITVADSTVRVSESSDFGNVTANNSSIVMSGAGDYSFARLSGENKTLVVEDLAANISLDQRDGSLNLTATGSANDNFGNAQESVERIQEVITNAPQAGDIYLLEQGVVNDGARIVYDENGQPIITYTRNSNMENFGTLAALSIVNWRNELNSLSKRMGELRDSPAGVGTWVRLYGSENELNSITARNTTVQVGADYSIGDWKVGVAVNYTDGDADFSAGSGDNENYGIAIYGTWLSESGQFVDLLAKYSRMDQDFQLNGMDGSYDNNAFALSVEYGWRFELGSLAFVEPQAAFTYSHIEGDSFRASGAEIDQDNYDSYIGRLGVRGGFKFPNNKGVIYARASYLYDFDGEMNATAHAVNGAGTNYIYEDLGGSWVEYGIGANFNLTDRTYTYVDLERNSGGEIKENWRWNIGLRHVF